MFNGKKIIDEINNCNLKKDEFALWWLGQHSFVIKSNLSVIYIDLFLTNLSERLVPPFFNPAEVTNASLFLGSHDHIDHIDRAIWPALAKASPNAKFVVPESIKEDLVKSLNIPSNRFIGLDDMQSFELPGIKITAITSAHEKLEFDSKGRSLFLGFVLEVAGKKIYHSGDCCIYEGLLTKLKKWNFDLMILPINGRDAVRLKSGCIGNMTYQEAADLAGAAGTKIVIPAHYDMFRNNLGSVADFKEYIHVKYPSVKVNLCEYAQCVKIN